MGIDNAALAEHRPYLLRYANLHLRDASQAEDVVQETLLAALQANFSGQSSLRTWLTGILKHKIVDLIRKQSREAPLASGEEDEQTDDFDALFTRFGHWTGADEPQSWQQPASALESRQFWRVYQQCTELMPKRVALVFSMREVMDMDIDEICKALSISATNCSVILYRARMSLRLCLDKHWFGKENSSR